MSLRDIIISVVGHVLAFVSLLLPSLMPARPLPPLKMVTVTAVTPQSVARLIEKIDRVEEAAPETPPAPVPVEKEETLPTPKKKPQKTQPVKRSDKSETPPPKKAPTAPPAKETKKDISLPGVRVDQEVDSDYLVAVVQLIRENWRYPNLNDPNLKSIVFFEIGRDGSLVRLRVEDRSGNVIFDKSVYDAVVKSNPLPGLPDGFPGTKLGVHLAFSY